MKFSRDEEIQLSRFVTDLVQGATLRYRSFIIAPPSAIFRQNEPTFATMQRKIEKEYDGLALYDLTRSFLFCNICWDSVTSDDMPVKEALDKGIDETIESIISDIKSLSRKYMFLSTLKKSWGDKLSERGMLPVKGVLATIADKQLVNTLPTSSPKGSIQRHLFKYGGAVDVLGLTEDREHYLRDKAAICSFGDGWYGEYCADLFEEASDKIAAVYGLMECFNILSYRPNNDGADIFATAYIQTGKLWSIIGTPKRRQDLLEFEKKFDMKGDWEAKGDEDRAFIRFQSACQIVTSGIDSAKPIFTALYWYFRSKLAGSKQEKVIDISICLEVLAGVRSDRDDPSIATLISTRTSYSIASSETDRQLLIKHIKSFYNIRSAIVHAGKRRLTNEEDISLFVTEAACKKLFTREIELLAADTNLPMPLN